MDAPVTPMRDILVSVPQNYKTEIKLRNGKTLYTNPHFGSTDDIIQYGEVIALPWLYKDKLVIKEGDVLFFHHNITRHTFMKGQTLKSKFCYDDNDSYLVPINLVYAFQRESQEIQTVAPYVFVEPYTPPLPKLKHGLVHPEKSKKISKQLGRLKYINDDLRELGLTEGDLIVYKKDADIKVYTQDETVYRMENDWILAKVEL